MSVLLLLAALLAEPSFGDGVLAYRDERYGEAAEVFATLAQAEPDPTRRGILHANAGTAAARDGRLGVALWHLEGARRLAPGDETAATNLALVRARLGEGPTEAEAFTQSLVRLPLRVGERDAERVAAGLVGLGLLLLALRRARLPAPPLGVALAPIVLAALWVPASGYAREIDLARAVVVDDAVPLRAEPSRTARTLFRVAEGAVVTAEEERDGWRLVETRAGARGWVPAETVRDAAR